MTLWFRLCWIQSLLMRTWTTSTRLSKSSLSTCLDTSHAGVQIAKIHTTPKVAFTLITCVILEGLQKSLSIYLRTVRLCRTNKTGMSLAGSSVQWGCSATSVIQLLSASTILTNISVYTVIVLGATNLKFVPFTTHSRREVMLKRCARIIKNRYKIKLTILTSQQLTKTWNGTSLNNTLK